MNIIALWYVFEFLGFLSGLFVATKIVNAEKFSVVRMIVVSAIFAIMNIIIILLSPFDLLTLALEVAIATIALWFAIKVSLANAVIVYGIISAIIFPIAFLIHLLQKVLGITSYSMPIPVHPFVFLAFPLLILVCYKLPVNELYQFFVGRVKELFTITIMGVIMLIMPMLWWVVKFNDDLISSFLLTVIAFLILLGIVKLLPRLPMIRKVQEINKDEQKKELLEKRIDVLSEDKKKEGLKKYETGG